MNRLDFYLQRLGSLQSAQRAFRLVLFSASAYLGCNCAGSFIFVLQNKLPSLFKTDPMTDSNFFGVFSLGIVYTIPDECQSLAGVWLFMFSDIGNFQALIVDVLILCFD